MALKRRAQAERFAFRRDRTSRTDEAKPPASIIMVEGSGTAAAWLPKILSGKVTPPPLLDMGDAKLV